ncbi:vascular endothelial growth factor C [Osmerus eperlanus]|uniref:vascular endothelial growth factor C n=1 Tax=Osmerus eperlanus TaxID=29151 RepID=UPI002E0DC2C0
MHIFGISVVLAYSALLIASEFIHELGQDYDDHEQDHGFPTESEPDVELQLRSAGSVDELLRLIYPGYWTALKCRSKRGSRFHAPSHAHSSETRTDEPITFAAAYLNMDVLKSIETEWRQILCMPREACLDVAREFGAPTNTFYKPPCVSVYRCGGCCNSEDRQCMNISTSYISKTLFEITVPMTQNIKPVTISVANHTQCRCLSKLDVYRQVHSIIRRALPECPTANRTCPHSLSWSERFCRCVPQLDTHPPSSSSSSSSQRHPASFDEDLCGPDRELDEETCQCVCRRPPGGVACGLQRHLDRNTCQCVCKTPPSSCPAHHTFNRDTCGCVCTRSCPRHQPLDRARCACECNESPNRCFLKGRRFHQPTCSCFRPPCDVRKRRCEQGFYFSEEVCRCIPTYWRRLD